ncbi:hypothetical protein G7B40_022175 [Aetokthonos hydrillicola Thurmond2011]|jgi:lactate dehydrogenase-like 2-hydroxyacid dehydrogenase|uniref:Uncharacterized protein n=1 Tax=Aetokthonos hydrillicola Thurmond2011 TaxID=2712845 RepID=A0AAP5I997_9CYAN|nr:hypothetical protein [Aetokthonos hydrillicola]MBO3460806.1 hypothetical protein [Aetokthonos hydrillicola CCALA 1050]MBW4588269.1 hypothetical protein [Aetokthonos hydrillicola CCALA 1050]MDR9897251.1 hypothetical protein [Aetokthonos hydrillicola Thurmond2011]
MSNVRNIDSENLSYKLQAIASVVDDAVQDCQGDVIALLAILRKLEQLHQQIRDGAFQKSLPDNRQGLYTLLKDMESLGGWPYIERMRLQAFLAFLQQEMLE